MDKFCYVVQLLYKDGVKHDGLMDIMDVYVLAISFLHFKHFKSKLVITSTTEGVHKKNSLHYKGLAVDVRIKDKTPKQINAFMNLLKFHFDKTLDIVLEKDHIHIEYDPKPLP